MSPFSPRPRRLASFAGAPVALALLISGCSSPAGTTASGDGGSADTISVQVPPVTDVAPLYLAQKKGLFEKQGLKVEITVGQGGAAVAAALQAGSTDIGFVNYVSALSGISNGLPISLIADGTRGTAKSFGLIVPDDSPIKSVSDLKGKTIGVISTGSVSDLTTNVQLAEAGLSPGDVKYVNVPLPNLLSAVGSQVDAVSVNEPTLSRGVAQGNRLVLDAYTGPIAGLPVAGYFATSDWAEDNAGAITRFSAVIAEASRAANDDQASVRALLPTFTTLKAPEADAITLPRFATTTEVDKVQGVADLMLRYKFLKTPVKAADHVAAAGK